MIVIIKCAMCYFVTSEEKKYHKVKCNHTLITLYKIKVIALMYIFSWQLFTADVFG